ncbi:hypothetical protein MPH_04368 [Macrophomina phaseolina MS6]|uniref:Uncharacterized protein n=1 Tax=Macrophomina phaseolina (strain MS6) TaxID=1126212 RepID=K2S059_MACPH|nr:hypothetical protein MPH_04368 [Macrophomina phaseolina MS6]
MMMIHTPRQPYQTIGIRNAILRQATLGPVSFEAQHPLRKETDGIWPCVPPYFRELREEAPDQCLRDLLAGFRVAILLLRTCNDTWPLSRRWVALREGSSSIFASGASWYRGISSKRPSQDLINRACDLASGSNLDAGGSYA